MTGSDIRVVQTAEGFGISLDWLLSPFGGLDTAQQIASAVIVALGTDRLADASDTLPGDDTDRRGWWGDLDAQSIWGGWPIGSRLWLLDRAKITGEAAREGATVGRVEAYIREALQPFIDNRIASSVDVTVERNGVSRIDALIRVYRGAAEAIDLRFAVLWSEIRN